MGGTGSNLSRVNLPQLFEDDAILSLSLDTDPEIIAEATEVLVRAFAGTTSTGPEACLSWCLDPDSSSSSGKNPCNPCNPLKEEPTDARLNCMRYNIRWVLMATLPLGLSFALKDDDGKIVAAALAFPPNTQSLYDPNFCNMIFSMHRLGWKNLPPELYKGEPSKRFDKLDKVMKKCHGEHIIQEKQIYLHVFGTHPQYQRKGYGSRLLSVLNSVADDLGVDIYLEASGKDHQNFYSKHDFEIRGHYRLECDNRRFEPDGLPGLAVMVRKSKGKMEDQSEK